MGRKCEDCIFLFEQLTAELGRLDMATEARKKRKIIEAVSAIKSYLKDLEKSKCLSSETIKLFEDYMNRIEKFAREEKYEDISDELEWVFGELAESAIPEIASFCQRETKEKGE